MPVRTQRVRALALLLAAILLGAQFHFCTDVSSVLLASHLCPLCSVAGFVVATQTPTVALIAVINRLETAPRVVSISSVISRAISPRAPPSL